MARFPILKSMYIKFFATQCVITVQHAIIYSQICNLLTACHVDPAVNSDFSKSTTSFMPCLAKWYAILVPRTPPPMITTSASSFKRLLSLEELKWKN